jgi:hypothetical protein
MYVSNKERTVPLSFTEKQTKKKDIQIVIDDRHLIF